MYTYVIPTIQTDYELCLLKKQQQQKAYIKYGRCLLAARSGAAT